MFIDYFNKFIIKISKLFNVLAITAIFLMMIIVVSNVVLRLFGYPLQFTIDYVEFMAVLSTSFALAYCGVEDGHISISLLIDKLPSKLQKIIDIIINATSSFFLFMIAYNVAIYANEKFKSGDVSISTGTPQYPFIYLLAVGLGLLALVVLGQLLNLLKKRGEN